MTGNLSASILARLLTLAKRRGDDYNLLLNRFAMERLLARVGTSAHAEHFLLKGALLFALWYDAPHRPGTQTFWASAPTMRRTCSRPSARSWRWISETASS